MNQIQIVAVAPNPDGAVVNNADGNNTVVPNQDGNNAPVAVAPNQDGNNAPVAVAPDQDETIVDVFESRRPKQ